MGLLDFIFGKAPEWELSPRVKRPSCFSPAEDTYIVGKVDQVP